MSADSAAETLLRQAFLRAGLPEPAANQPLVVDGVNLGDPDLHWKQFGVCVEYDGYTHLTPEQQHLDIRRGDRRRDHGVEEVRVVFEDVRGGYDLAVPRVRRRLLERGWNGSMSG
ncbi:MAG: hypothetical protein Q4G40_07010 [Brachybacterium sp.]|nr:hypothetical protein [Brachybacterium sp.]